MRRLFVTGTLVVLLYCLGHAALRPPLNAEISLSQGAGPVFRCQVAQRLEVHPDSSRLLVAVSVPYDHLTFLRADSGFTASFELVQSIFKDKTILIQEKIQNVDVTVKSYNETNSKNHNAMRADEFVLPLGDYMIRISLMDKESRKKTKWEGTVTCAARDTLLELSDIYWISDDSSLSDLQIPRLIDNFVKSDKKARARFQMLSKATAPIRVQWSVINTKKDTVTTSLISVIPTGTIQFQDYELALDSLLPDQYQLMVEADGNGRREVRQRAFGTTISGVPAAIKNLDLAIRQLRYISTAEENNRFRHAQPAEKEQLFRDFWKRRDPSEGTDENELMEEYYGRVRFANERYSTNREGWETDRGRIYILYGEPTDIERHPFDSDSRPYEIWFYSNLSRRFVFVDYTGFGDYTLAGPEWGY